MSPRNEEPIVQPGDVTTFLLFMAAIGFVAFVMLAFRIRLDALKGLFAWL